MGGERADALDLGQPGSVARPPLDQERHRGPGRLRRGLTAVRRQGSSPREAAITAGDWVQGDNSGATTSERQRNDIPSGVTRSAALDLAVGHAGRVQTLDEQRGDPSTATA